MLKLRELSDGLLQLEPLQVHAPHQRLGGTNSAGQSEASAGKRFGCAAAIGPHHWECPEEGVSELHGWENLTG